MENRRYLLISDLDGTLLGDDEALEEFSEWYEQQQHLLRLVYNSGRLIPSIRESIESTALPQPAALIGGVGTQIHDFHTGQSIGNWLDDCQGWQPERIGEILAKYQELELQPDEFLSDYKISYYAENAAASLIDELRRKLQSAGCDVELVYSSNRDLDVLPRGADKGNAAAFLAAHWSFDRDCVFVSGDSGNDRAMFEQGFRGIVVENAHLEMKRLNSSSVFQATHAFAAGVQEGLCHWLTSHTTGSEQPADSRTAACG